MTRPVRRDRHRHQPGRHRPARLRLLLGRDRLPARHHPPGRPATLGPHLVTAATAALESRTLPGSGPGATADDTADHPGPTSAPGNASSPRTAPAPTRSGCAAASTPSTWPPANSPRSTTPPPNPAECCTSRAATAARPSARPARPSTSATPASSSAPGLAGGKGIPETVAAHPCVFATLTAPSFGPVHARRMRGKTVLPCRPRRDAQARRCPHGRDISCPTRHVEDDPRLGRPMCGDCYDYEAAVLFNAYAGDLWRRFTTYLPRHLARLAGRHPEDAARPGPHPLRQGRRVPGTRRRPLPRRHPPGRPRRGLPAPAGPVSTADLLCDAIGQAAAAVRLDRRRGDRPRRPARLRRADRHPAHPPRHDLPAPASR